MARKRRTSPWGVYPRLETRTENRHYYIRTSAKDRMSVHTAARRLGLGTGFDASDPMVAKRILEQWKLHALKRNVTHLDPARQRQAEGIKLSEFRDEYLEMRRRRLTRGELKFNTVRNDELALNMLIRAVGDIPLRSLGVSHRERFKDMHLLKANRSDPRSLERRKGGCDSYMRSLRTALNWAVLDTTVHDPVGGKPSYLPYNPFRQQTGAQGRVMFKRGGKLPRDLAERDLTRLLKTLESRVESAREGVMRASTSVREMEGMGLTPIISDVWSLRDAERRLKRRTEERWLVLWYLLTGLRRAELVNLSWNDVHLEARMIRVLGKGDKERMVPILDELMEVIEAMGPKDIGRVFPRWQCKSAVTRLVKRIMREAGLENYTLHNLRDTYATRLLACGVRLEHIQENMGHADISMTRKYSRVIDERRRQETIEKVHFGTSGRKSND